MIYSFEKRDEFNRQVFADRLIDILKLDQNVSPIIIDGQWGTGKTEFCLKTVHQINKDLQDKFLAIHIDAFSEDYFNQPLISILVSFYSSVPEQKTKRNLLQLSTNVLKATATVGAHVAIHKILGPEGDNLSKDFFKALRDENNKQLSNFLKERAKLQEHMELLRTLLKSYTEKKKIVLFIDELDRCRPDYTIQMLETIKHLFDIPGLSIVLITNTRQVLASIKHAYGIDSDVATKYLDKFHKLSIQFPENVIKATPSDDDLKASVQYFNTLFTEQKLDQYEIFNKEDKYEYTRQLICELIDHFKFSLRDVERLVLVIQLYGIFCSKKLSIGYRLISAFTLFSVARQAPWIDTFLENKNNFPSLSADLTPHRTKKGQRSVMQLTYDSFYTHEHAVLQHLGLDYEEVADRQNFCWNLLNNMKSFNISN